jgi:stringent starvation protein B
MHQWISDCGHTPHVIVDASVPGAQLPKGYVRDGRIVLNIGYGATDRLELAGDALDFAARFGGVVHQVHVPMSAVLGIYARETGEGMVFAELEPGDGPEPGGPAPEATAPEGGGPGRPTGSAVRRPSLKVVK